MLIKKIVGRLLSVIEKQINRCIIKCLKIPMGQDCMIRGVICFEGTSQVEIKDCVKINSGKRYNIIGGDSRTVFRTVGSGKIVIGKGCGISNSTFVSAEKIELKDNVLIGGGCKLYDTDFHPIDMNARIQNDNR